MTSPEKNGFRRRLWEATFPMAEFLEVSCWEVVMAAMIPAVLYTLAIPIFHFSRRYPCDQMRYRA